MPPLAAQRILLPGARWTGPATITVDGARITAINEGLTPTADIMPGGVLTPGLIDLHNNGAFGVDFATADPGSYLFVRTRLAACGVTSVQPTIITAPLPEMLACLTRFAAAANAFSAQPAARTLGVHMEGPFLSSTRRGAHNPDWLQDPTPAALATLLDHPARRILRTITLAPERAHALEAIYRLTQAGIIVALGHTDATADQARAAIDAGATIVTHLFNAMRPFSHRDPALPGAALTDPRLWCCLIVDAQHVAPLACRLAFAAAPGRVVAVSDSISIAGMPAGTRQTFGGQPVIADETGLGRRPDGTISGAGITLDEGIRRMISAGLEPAIVLHAATETPATALHRPDLGRIAPGARADLIWWDDDWIPRRVWIDGQEVRS